MPHKLGAHTLYRLQQEQHVRSELARKREVKAAVKGPLEGLLPYNDCDIQAADISCAAQRSRNT